jgi:cytochrome c peroxidase
LLLSIGVNGCRKTDFFGGGTPLPIAVPAHFPQPLYDFENKKPTVEGYELGRRLFHEGRLSKDGSVSCASCHNQDAAFTMKNHDLGHGYNGSHTTRNPIALQNLAWFREFYHDGSASSLEEVSVDHITSPVDMAETPAGVVAKLRSDTAFRRLFRAAYGDERVTMDRILQSLTQYLVHLVSAGSRYDEMRSGGVQFTAAELRGYTLFQAKCNSCHAEPLFTDGSYRNNGMPLSPLFLDAGRMRVTGKGSDSLKFRVPTLRNIFVSGTYTHDGRIGAVRTMINHYRTGIRNESTTLDPLLSNGIALSNGEVDDLLLFLRTLTDSSYLANPRFGP